MKRSEERTSAAKRRIFEQIEALMDTHNMTDITFGKIAKRLGCQPNSVAYYFNNKMDMLQQFTQEHMRTADTVYMPVLRAGIESLPPVERFCREIDCFFAASEQKSKPHLLNNYFLISNAPLRSEFNEDLSRKIRLDQEENRRRLEAYLPLGILEESRFRDAFVEGEFYDSSFSLTRIFNFPIWAREDRLHNAKERLKAAFLKDGLYTPQYRKVVLPKDFPCADMAAAEARYRVPDDRIPALKTEVFRQINRLLEEDRPDDITFARLGELCYCQPSGIAYYFKNKEDMILQALIWKAESHLREQSREPASRPQKRWDLAECCRLICHFTDVEPLANRYNFWVNYLVLSNLNLPAYRDYFCFSERRNANRLHAALRRFAQEPFFREENLEEAFAEMYFFHDGIAMHDLFKTPLTEPKNLIRITRRRFARLLIREEYLEEAFALLDGTALCGK